MKHKTWPEVFSSVFVPRDLAEEMRELGFSGECLMGISPSGKVSHKFTSNFDGDYVRWDTKYDDDLPIPTWEQAFGFFRDMQPKSTPFYECGREESLRALIKVHKRYEI
jgi:hypothetical protein